MTQVTITLTTTANLLGVFLHHPGNTPSEPLPGVTHSVLRDLPDGEYHVSVAGTGIPPGTPVTIEFKATTATGSSARARGGRVSAKGTIAMLKQFDLNNGLVS